MTLSVSAEAERELIDGALFSTGKANADLGLAFIAEFERTLDDQATGAVGSKSWR